MESTNPCAGCPHAGGYMRAASNQMTPNLPLIGDPAPSFKAVTTNGEINFPDDYKGKWVVFFSHPADFTPVCTTEFMTFASMQDEFEALNTELVGLSVDGLQSHIAWIHSVEQLKFRDIDKPEIKFPIIVDISMEVSKKYGMIQPNQSTTAAVRAVFIVDPEGMIRTILYYPMSTGRNFQEIKRIIQALQKTDKDGTPTPADWQPGEPGIIPPSKTTAESKKVQANKGKDGRDVKDWYLVFEDKI